PAAARTPEYPVTPAADSRRPQAELASVAARAERAPDVPRPAAPNPQTANPAEQRPLPAPFPPAPAPPPLPRARSGQHAQDSAPVPVELATTRPPLVEDQNTQIAEASASSGQQAAETPTESLALPAPDLPLAWTSGWEAATLFFRML